MKTQIFLITPLSAGETVIAALSRGTSLPKGRLKDAMSKGALWLKRGKRTNRIRRSTAELRADDQLELYYNPDILARLPPQPTLLADEKQYSVWHKPPGLLAQGSREGDHCSLLRIAEQQLGRTVKLIHRLDREASGLMLIAHTDKAASTLSSLFLSPNLNKGIRKDYRIEVRGELPPQGEFSSPLDGKDSLTRFVLEQYNSASDSSIAIVELVTGRKHQIRRHFAEAGFGILGDPEYGESNADKRGLQLQAIRLRFTCPISHQVRDYQLNQPALAQAPTQ